jgi:hypothetical protein
VVILLYSSCMTDNMLMLATSAGVKMPFQDCVAINTGSGQGLGRVLAHRFAAEGAAVVLADVVFFSVRAW